jgi:hypothetical protein
MSDFERQWLRTARQTRRKANFAWWLQGLGGPLVAAALLVGCATLWARRQWPATVADWGSWPVLAMVAGCGFCVWWFVRRRFLSTRQALVAMEVRQGLHNALSTAADGHGAWPAPPPYPPKVFRWYWPNILVPPVVAAILVAAGFWLPVPPPELVSSPEEPAAWAKIEADLHRLEDQQVIDPQSAAEPRSAIDQLRSAGPGQWFNHASLEATDELKAQHQRALKALAKNLRQAATSAGALAAGAQPPLTPPARQNRQEQFQQALEGLRAAGLKPNAALWEKLQQLDPAQLGQVDPAQLEALRQQLGEAAGALREIAGLGEGEPGGGDDGDEELMAGLGNGGVDRGPGSSDDLFGAEKTELEATQPQPLRPRDLSRSEPGELLNLENRQHEVEEVSPGLQQGGTARIEGGGGGAWQDALHPAEQEALKRFFEPAPAAAPASESNQPRKDTNRRE